MTTTGPTTFRAKHVVPIEGAPIENGAVEVVDGRITAVGPAGPIASPHAVDFGECVLLPGFVNAHTHLELTTYADQLPTGDLWDWIPALVRQRALTGQFAREQDGIRRGAALALQAGTTTLADISRQHTAWPILCETPLRCVCFAELLCFAAEPARTIDELAEKVRATRTDARRSVGIAPHAPYSVTPRQLRDCVAWARRERLPLTMHVAETPEERQYIETGTGRLYELLAAGGFVEKNPPPRQPLFEYLAASGLFDGPALLAHVNDVSDAELDRLSRSACTVVYCPRAHRFFGHAAHRFRDMLARGINVCLGTDSLASNASLSILDEMRFLHREYPDLDVHTLLEMGTRRGARGLCMEAHIGTLAPGKRADFVVVPLHPKGSARPLVNVLESASQPLAVAIDGETFAVHAS
ncbi:MAG: amidohydrolase family protein [Phycisphaerae bacterium]|nr:amidohydrolase family protein [Phycisphaerae bacterium]